MELQDLCMGCMGERGSAHTCPHCGWEEGTLTQSPLHLAAGTILHDKYLIGRVLGQGGFGITYLAWDVNLNLKLAIKEYLPQDLASRAAGHTEVAAYTGSLGNEFEYGLEKFLQEARTLAQFEGHPNIVSVRDFFRANGTAYIVMSYVEGVTLKDFVAQQGNRLPFDKALAIIMPVLDALSEVHEVNILHRDISPDNIFMNRKGQVILIDFGAARHAIGEKGHSRSIIMKPGFTPEEQYRSKGIQGPWTDIYAVAATLYRIVTGQMPPESLDRLAEDTLVPPSQFGVGLSHTQEQVLLKAMAVRAEQRFQKVKDLQDALLGKKSVSQMTAAQPSQGKWHISRDGARFGPYTWEQMVKMAEVGNLGSLDLVWSPGMSDWQKASELDGLFSVTLPSPQGVLPREALPRRLSAKKSRAGLIVGISVCLLFAVGLILLISRGFSNFERQSPLAAGNTAANIVNWGIAAVEGDWIYYRSSNEVGKLYKMKADGSETALVSDDSPWFINILDGWIYYANWGDEDRVYKIRSDGSGRTVLNDQPSAFVSVTEKWIFYINVADGNTIYRMNRDGGERTKVGDAGSWHLNAVGEWLFFINDDEDGNIYKMRADGSALTRLNDQNCGNVVVAEDWIYYINNSDGSTIYRMRLDGSQQKKLNNDSSWNLNLSDGWLYYINTDDSQSIYKMLPDGSSPSSMNSDAVSFFNIVDDWIFYLNQDDDYQLYVMRTKGSDRRLVSVHDDNTAWSYQVEYFKFFESALQGDYPDGWEPAYSDSFPQSSTYYIYFVLALTHPPVEYELTLPATFIYSGADGSELVSYDFSCTFFPGNTSTNLNGYFGWDQPGNWQPGSYRVELWLDDIFVAENHFEVK